MVTGTTWSAEDESYKQLGRFVVAFQNVESVLSTVTGLLLDGDRSGRTDIILAKVGFKNLIDATDVMFARFVDERMFSDGAQRKSDFHQLCQRCRTLGDRRNALIHSTYAHLYGDKGYKGLLREKLRLKTGGGSGPRPDKKEEILTSEDFDISVKECKQIVSELDGFRLWLIEEIFV